MANRKVPEINAGSMADIAFLLLVFFLVTTTIQTDSGLSVLLPPYEENPEENKEKIERRNVFDVKINSQNALLIRSSPGQLATLKGDIKEFILNPSKREDLSASPKVAVITLLNDNGTSYDMYVSVYNELKAAYRELWDEQADKMFGRGYESLSKENQGLVRKEIPLVISEAEPTDFGTK